MPQITVNSFDINYKILGKGEPLLLIMGLSFSLLDWGTVLPELLSQHYQVILFDNRDAGQSSHATEPYPIANMADDVAGLLDALDISKAHIFGVSMGGMIAQHFALSHPDKLSKLMLGCTMAGRNCSEFGSFSEVLTGNSLEWLFPIEFIQANQAQLVEFLQTTVPYHSQEGALSRQLHAMNSHDTCDVLDKITAPTLVITGEFDRVIPAQNSQFLIKKIPAAALEIIAGAGHAFCFSHPEATATSVINFLQQ